MPPAADETAETSAGQNGDVQTEDWADGVSEPSSHDSERRQFRGDGLNTGVKVLSDGRLDIKIHEHKPSIAGLLHHLGGTPMPSELSRANSNVSRASSRKGSGKDFPLRLNIVIQVIGSRGDIQPFVALGKELKKHGHRVRLATHLAFRDFVNEGGLEFFNIGGDPAELMAFMVKNPGLLPNIATLRSGAILKRRREMKQIIEGCWKSCYKMGDGTDMHQIKDDPFSEDVDYRRRPFVADAIIANPPSLAHIHCAQRLGIPLHIMFTMPWSPTQSFPHPLAILHQKDCQPTVANFVSYAMVDMMVWEGLGDIVNKWRKNTLTLDPLDSITAPSLIHRLQIPCSYLWSPAVLPKPVDWGNCIDICGFSFLPAKSDYTPPNEIKEFLEAGPTPIYVGFGSIVVDDQITLTKIVFEAIKKTGQRAIVSRGWGNLGVDEVDVPDNILLIGSCPHDWLFQQVSCVIHHGGAGTTAAGLALGCPTIIVPFFGDQEFWGNIVAKAGAGPVPIPHKRLTVEKLSAAIEMALKDSTKERAQEIAKKMKNESGVRDGVYSFHRQLNIKPLRCAICPSRPAVWHLKHTEVGLSAFAASTLVEMGKLDPQHLVLNRPMEYDTYRDPVGPLSASAQVLFGAIANFVIGLADVPTEMAIDLVSAGKQLGHNHKPHHDDPRRKWHMRKTHNEDELASEEDSQEQVDQQKHENFEETVNNSHSESSNGSLAQPSNGAARESEPLDGEETGSGDSDDSVSNSSNLLPEAGVDRVRSQQLEKIQTMNSEMASSKPRGFFSEVRIHGSRMGKKFVNFVIWIPTDLTLSMSKGFHNAPKIYHDNTVKATPKVHGIRSGFKAAGQELRDGFYYGATGLVTHPQRGYKEKGAKGMMKGVGKGLCGAFLKPPAGLWGLAGYPLTGIRRNLLDSLGKRQEGQIVASRIAQGHEEMRKSSAEDRAEVVRKWILVEEKALEANRRCRRSHSRSKSRSHSHSQSRSHSHSQSQPHAPTYAASSGMAA